MTTPHEVVNACVERTVNSSIATAQRLVIGQDNEVYDVTTRAGQGLIVRISPRADPRFEAERWALDAARAAGVPTPQVFLVEKVACEDKVVTFCIEEKLPGIPLETMLREGIGQRELAPIIAQAGDLLSRIHQVKVAGFGYLQPDGKGWRIPFSAIMLDLLEKQAELRRAATLWGLPNGTVERGLTLLAKNSALYEWNQPALVHGDYGPPHILVDNGCVSGIIDMQECSGNHPAFDFAHWAINYGELVPVEGLLASYSDKSLFDDRFWPLLELIRLRDCLWMLMVRAEQGNPQGAGIFVAGIERALCVLQ